MVAQRNSSTWNIFFQEGKADNSSQTSGEPLNVIFVKEISPEENLAEIVKNSQSNDLKAQELLVKSYQARVAGFIFSMLGNQDGIEDITQIIFIKALKRISSLKDVNQFQSWLFKIARNTCLDHIRARRWKRLFVSFGKDHEQIPARSNLQFTEQYEWFLKELQTLPENQREIIGLIQDDALSYQEMASILGCTVESVKSRIFRARSALNERRKKYEHSKSK